MSIPCEEIRPELEALLGAMTDGRLDLAGKRRLSTILREHPDARQFYLDYCQMHALLQSAHGVLEAMEAPSMPRWRRVGMAVAAAVLIAAATAAIWRRALLVEGTVASVGGTAWVERQGERSPLLGGLRGLLEGDRVATGPGSRMEVLLGDRSRLELLDRTEVEFGRRLALREGTLRCSIRPQKSPLAFETPHASATVIGTEFELSAGWKETRLRTQEGCVRLAAQGRSVDVNAGQIGTADATGVCRWDPLCSFDFTRERALPPGMSAAFCDADEIHSVGRHIGPGGDRLGWTANGLRLGADDAERHKNGLTDLEWNAETGEDVIVEVEVAGGRKWGLGIAVSGNGFEGFRVFFAAIDDYPNGIAIDTIHPGECIVLARDPRPIPYDRGHVLRVERRGSRIRAWVDGELRIDTEVDYPLAQRRRRVFSLCNFGAPPILLALRAWKANP